jgi:hypothetical protein
VVRELGSAVFGQLFHHHGRDPPTVTDRAANSAASSHTTPDAGNLTSFQPFNLATPSSIIVGNVSVLPFTSVGDTVLPDLNNIFVTLDIIKNLLSLAVLLLPTGILWSLTRLMFL